MRLYVIYSLYRCCFEQNLTQADKDDSLYLGNQVNGIPDISIDILKSQKHQKAIFTFYFIFHNNFLTVGIILHNSLHS